MSGKYSNLIFKNDIKSLSTIPFHGDVPCIERYCPENFPVQVAVHAITAADNVEEYTAPHSHDHMHELNIIVGEEGKLEYSVRLGDEMYIVCSNSSIWIPAGLKHATNVIRGSGYYIVMKFEST
jgi:hypothetical protein